MDEQLSKDLESVFKELEDFCIKTLAEVAIMRVQVDLLKTLKN